jgi:hypothetical protein
MARPSPSCTTSGDELTIGLLTLTGGRPEAFALCERWIQGQTIGHDQWVVVDDVADATEVTMGQTVLRPEPFWHEGERTLNRNFQAGLPEMDTDIILMIEDDDYYSPCWLETVRDHFATSDDLIVGEGWTTYYNVATLRYLCNSNNKHASLCATAFRREITTGVLAILRSLKAKSPFVDSPIWTAYRCNGTIWDTDHVIGIKGMPGRPGCGKGHRESLRWPSTDPAYNNLVAWLGEDAEVYKGRCAGFPPENAMPPNMRESGQCSKN